MRPGPGEVLHVSDDPSIARFVPRRAPTQQIETIHVWAVDAFHAPSYWFPRDCPRALAGVVDGTTDADRERILGPGGASRVHAVEPGWVERIRAARLWGYRLPADRFRPVAPGETHAFVCDDPVDPLGPPEPIDDLLGLHAAAGIELRVIEELHAFWAGVVTSSLGFSGIRLANARPSA